MSQIRRQSIISTVFVYAGFAVGILNTYLFTRQGFFSEAQYGLTGQLFVQVGNLMFAFANLGMLAVIYKFYPYYNDNLKKKDNDLLSWTLLICIFGFILVCLAGYLFKDVVVRKFGRSPEFLQYYFWIFPFGLGILLFSLLEVFAWNLKKSILTTFLREVLFRALTTILIILYALGVIESFEVFVKIYAFTYGFVAMVLLVYLVRKKEFHITLSISRVTKKFYKKMAAMASFIYFGGIVYMIAQTIDSIVIASVINLRGVAIFGLGSVLAGLVQAPQRGAIAATIPVLAQAWKDKNYAKINLIYQRSGINLLIASLGLFLLIWLNYEDGVTTFHLKESYLQSQWVFFFLGLSRIIDLGTGVNSQIIATSIFWRFEFLSGVVLLGLAIPLNYFLVKEFGVIGAGYSNLIAFSVYNVIRIIYLKRKFDMQPFSIKSAYAILLALGSYMICYFLFRNMSGILAMTLRSVVFIAMYAGTVIYFHLSPDVLPVWKTLKGKLRIKP